MELKTLRSNGSACKFVELKGSQKSKNHIKSVQLSTIAKFGSSSMTVYLFLFGIINLVLIKTKYSWYIIYLVLFKTRFFFTNEILSYLRQDYIWIDVTSYGPFYVFAVFLVWLSFLLAKQYEHIVKIGVWHLLLLAFLTLWIFGQSHSVLRISKAHKRRNPW